MTRRCIRSSRHLSLALALAPTTHLPPTSHLRTHLPHPNPLSMTTSTTARPLPIPLPPTLIPALLASDSSIYPSPLTLSTLTSWITTAPSSTLYYPSSGIAVSLPLQLPYWLLLTSGELKEWELTPSMFAAPGAAAAEVGVHVWHVERWDGWRREWGVFGDVVRQDLGLAAGGRWSALVVTHEGRRMFERRWGGREGAYSGQVVVGGVLREREEWERKGGVGTVEGWGVMIVGGGGGGVGEQTAMERDG